MMNQYIRRGNVTRLSYPRVDQVTSEFQIEPMLIKTEIEDCR